MTTLEQAVGRVLRAIHDPGPYPAYHYQTLWRHRDEWPTLWTALDNLAEVADKERK